ncbi:6-phospho-3-hexuloisomerase [Pseudarthrobacter raffinosi]|uniref:6-phospho-3-hexuloisomerase n=1 Tax=Pseudarthrobacter raffinosi TaxID=2953651 RepID=UPI00208E34A5|nr:MULTISPECIES: 6-phospho-3-hexuloisomerase [unclassified Pseudarthrobacter]MCO4239373.1 6-phospho-3-hexuloisomerase [Pseudarthrobacter sp. MDT3-28]MCO4251320.1 6-phospho-3-hexuloisomerase [Pseudarthrobacter sp. MDT3-9]MCO4264918.1 6-phospho-3-hexuloisomerase [Pseudarthrobacter sp. MDT3-26]
MSVTAETSPAGLTGTSKAFDRNRALVLGEISAVSGRVDPAQVAALVTELRLADRIFVTGAGRSGLVLKMAAMRLMHLGLTVHVVGETTAPAIRTGDLLLAASGSGSTASVVTAAETAAARGARVAAYTTSSGSPLAAVAIAVVLIPAAQKTDHGSAVSRQYSGSLFEQVLFTTTEAVFQSLWDEDAASPEDLWQRHANLE